MLKRVTCKKVSLFLLKGSTVSWKLLFFSWGNISLNVGREVDSKTDWSDGDGTDVDVKDVEWVKRVSFFCITGSNNSSTFSSTAAEVDANVDVSKEF